ncbi:biofilm regulation diguanylate cyclase SiaD [Telmatospirillum siberiense]|uniref:diguanylate cyclase n=1 Tax=Telmatospirillum siberiense TaxID=382514 RepID=A0A2N3Q1S9_9PROT|nr:biofilm regulation diguanylate cyclase SiaD [Telmatospirillum siberiense]PKU26617.1 GGDEF domain-containing protein [Telmatospirillum siberiense]
MPPDRRPLDDIIEDLLADSQYEGHPLRDALNRLWTQSRDHLNRLERIAHISDGYQKMAFDQTISLQQRYDRELRRLEKAVRISDRYQDMMRELNNALQDASTRDHLTGLANRRMLVDQLKMETQRAERQGHSYTLAMLDVDHFKQVNDLYGHDLGDRALIEVAGAMQRALREYDLCGRWGGEEFLILLPQTSIGAACSVIERVRESLQRKPMPGEAPGTGIKITASIGLAEHQPGEGFSDTVNRADEALLEAKRAGRDCYRLA